MANISDHAAHNKDSTVTDYGKRFNVSKSLDIKGKDCCGSPFLDYSIEDCAAKCYNEEHCLGFSMQTNVSACWLK